ncbi:MAG: hypothetical protein IKQ46_06870 [Bacteroidales bacterium]|nr:hypothetical protein [Bacteroidales bacterium]
MANRQTIQFNSLPTSVDELKSLPQAAMKDPFEVAALVVAVLCNYENSDKTTIEMLNYLKGPHPLSPYDIQFLRDRLVGKYYKPRSYFLGSTPENGYQPTQPYTIEIFDNPYSYVDPNYAVLWMNSSGADSQRQIKLRRKGDGHWFYWTDMLLADIRIPKAEDPWA